MKYSKVVVAGAIVVSSQSGKADESVLISTNNLVNSGYDEHIVRSIFYYNKGLNLNANDFLKVSAENEGNNIKFETLDQVSIVVPRDLACGVGNKDFKD